VGSAVWRRASAYPRPEPDGLKSGSGNFPAAILPGSVVHEGVPLALASIHAGDRLVKLIVAAAIVDIWR
jgi:hypothetical protein